MPTEAKRRTVDELRQQLSQSPTLIVSEYRGLTVKEIGEIRRSLRKQDVTYKVIKNRLMKIAAADTRGTALDALLVGPTAIAFGIDETSDRQGGHRHDAPVQAGPDHRRPAR